MNRIPAYVSSSYDDLLTHRTRAVDVLRRHQFEEHGMESYSAHPSLVARCLDDVRECELFILILAWRYGEIRAPFDKSLTELEYEEARNANLHVVAFMLDKEAPWPTVHCDGMTGEGEGGMRIRRFRERLYEDGLLVKEFGSVEQFEQQLSDAVAGFRAARPAPAPQEPASTAPATDVGEFAVRSYLSNLIESKAEFSRRHVALSSVTHAQLEQAEPWAPELVHPSFRLTSSVPARTESSRVVLGTVEEALAIHRQFLLVGGPGAGKSTTLQHLLVTAAERRIADPRAPFPLLVDISAWEPETVAFSDLLARESRDQTGMVLVPDRLLLLIDGYLEPTGVEDDGILSQIDAWLKKRRCSAVVAVRTQNVPVELPSVRLNPLDDPGIQALVENLLGAAVGAELLAWLRGGPESGGERDHVMELIRNPFNLSLMCFLRVQDRAPSTRGELMRSFVRAAHYRELHAHPDSELDYESFVCALGRLAMDSVRMRKPRVMSMDWVDRRLPPLPFSAEALVPFARDCRVLRTGENGVEFEHRLVMEYFAAEYLSRYSAGSLESVLDPPRYRDAERVPQRLDEVFRTLCQLQDAGTAFDLLARYDPCLAASCATTMETDDDGGDPVAALLVGRLVGLLESADYSEREASTTALVKLGARCVPPLRRAVERAPHWVRRQAVVVMSQIPCAEAIEGIFRALGDSHRWVRHEAERAILGLDADGISILEQYIVSTNDRGSIGAERELGEHLLSLCAVLDERLAASVAQAYGLPVPVVVPGEIGLPEVVQADGDKDAVEPLPIPEVIAWGQRFLTSWRGDPGNPEYVSEGQRWLRSSPLSVEEWPYVWTALWNHAIRDELMERLAQRWLADEEGSAAWSEVWLALWSSRGEPWLLGLALQWLTRQRRHPGWPAVWRTLWGAGATPELATLGWAWLENGSSVSHKWGVVWLALREARPTSYDLEGVARRWIVQAPNGNASWSYVWSALWKENPGDPVLRARARDWLLHVPSSNTGWGFVWGGLWNSTERNAELERSGREWLRNAPPSHPSWEWVWSRLWEAGPGDEELASLGRAWLNAAPAAHHGWARVWSGLFEHAPANAELTRAGARWLAAIPLTHMGWGYVWTRLQRQFSTVPGLMQLGMSWMTAADITHPTFYSVWRVLWEHDVDRDTLEARGWEWLRGPGARSPGFGYVWDSLWHMYPGNDELAWRARDWLQEARKGAWYHVWKALWKAHFGDASLVDLATRWLVTNEDDERSWRNVWKALLPVALHDARFVAAGVHLLRARADAVGEGIWAEVAADLQCAGCLPADLEALHRQVASAEPDENTLRAIRAMADGMAPNDVWARRWVETWDRKAGRAILVASGARWLAIPSTMALRQWPFVWRSLYQRLGPDDMGLIELGRRWLSGPASPDQPGWGLVWEPVAISEPRDGTLRTAAWRWMHASAFSRSSWPRVFARLWELDAERHDELAVVGREWLHRTAPGTEGGGLVWSLLWEHSPAASELESWGLALLKSPRTSDGWPQVPLRLAGSSTLQDVVVPRLREWLRDNPDHSSVPEVQEFVHA